jgi:hypothetical protein
MFSHLARLAGRYSKPDPLMHDPYLNPKAPEPGVRYFVSVGFGAARQSAALAVIERTTDRPARYCATALKRFAEDTSYEAIAQETAELLKKPPLTAARLIVDAGKGRPVLQRFRTYHSLTPIEMSGDEGISWTADRLLRVSGGEVASAVLVCVQDRRFEVLEQPGARDLVNGLRKFSSNAGWMDRLANWLRGGDAADPLVRAVALALWYGESQHRHLRLL